MNDRFKFRVWDTSKNKYSVEDWLPMIDEQGDLCFRNTDDVVYYPPTDQFIIEQCTGLKDKNGKLIYEGDILDCELQDIDSHGYPFIHFKKGIVKRAKNGAYCVEGDDDFYASDITLYPIEIIGNIHEQAEQKE